MQETQRAETGKRSSAHLRYFLVGLAILLATSACDAPTTQELATAALEGHDSTVWSVAFSPDGKTLASGSWDKTVKLWGAQTRRRLATLYGHGAMVLTVAFSPDGKTLASGSRDKAVKLWDAQTGQELATLEGHDDTVLSVAFSPNGKTLASGSADKTVKLWGAQTRQELAHETYRSWRRRLSLHSVHREPVGGRT